MIKIISLNFVLIITYYIILIHKISIASIMKLTKTHKPLHNIIIRRLLSYNHRYIQLKSSLYNEADVNFDHITKKTSYISSYWIQQLKRIDRPSAKNLIPLLVPDNVLGYEGVIKGPARKGTLVDYVLEQKKKHEDKVILLRCGEFYETYGIDAIMMVAYAGLNPMGNKCKAGTYISYHNINII